MEIKGAAAVVTGGAGGLGEATVRRLVAPAVSLTWNRAARTVAVRVSPGARTSMTLKVGHRMQIVTPVRSAGLLTASVGSQLRDRTGLFEVTAAFPGGLTVSRQDELSTAVPHATKSRPARVRKARR